MLPGLVVEAAGTFELTLGVDGTLIIYSGLAVEVYEAIGWFLD